MSTAGADCVMRPTEMKSTPVSAIARMVSRRTPPEASSGTRPPESATALRSSSTLMLSSRIMSAPASSASFTCSSVSHSTSILVRTGTPARARFAQLRGVLLQRAQARSRLARVDQQRARARDALGVLRGERGDACEVLEKIQGGALGREQAASRAFHPSHRGAGPDALAVLHPQLDAAVRHAAAENLRRDIDPGDDDVLARVERELRARVGRDHQLRGQVAKADVLGERALDQLFDDGGIDHGMAQCMGARRRSVSIELAPDYRS